MIIIILILLPFHLLLPHSLPFFGFHEVIHILSVLIQNLIFKYGYFIQLMEFL